MSLFETVRLRFCCRAEDIAYVAAAVDSYDGLGLMRTLDRKTYACALYTTESLCDTALEVLHALKAEGAGISEITVERTESAEPT